MPQLPLSELRVVEISSGDALGYCGKMFADFGADVIKIEPPDGDVARRSRRWSMPAMDVTKADISHG
jgi:crotonobetainyl-CoA:carnitine CoA-transferase CaiB-like acyl-CoA transferase